jgi:opacity protein-like surface antigen
VLGSLPVGREFALFLRGGALFADREVHIPFSLGEGDITYGDTIWLAGAGVDWNLAKAWTMRAEYQRTVDFRIHPDGRRNGRRRISVRVKFSF